MSQGQNLSRTILSFIAVCILISSVLYQPIKATPTTHLIFGSAEWSEGGAALNALVQVNSSMRVLSTTVDASGYWSVDCDEEDWPEGTLFWIRVTGCCSHEGWTGFGEGEVTGQENDMGLILVYPNEGPLVSDPSGPTELQVAELGTFYASAIDPEVHSIRIRFDWDAFGSHETSGWTPPASSGSMLSINHSWGGPGTYAVKAQAQDIYGENGEWSDPIFVIVNGTNTPPETTNPWGPEIRGIEQEGEYWVSGEDLEESKLRFRFDWDAEGNHDISSWTEYVYPSVNVSRNHSWDQAGMYAVQVQAMDWYGAVSEWSESFFVLVPSENIPPQIPSVFGPNTSRINVSTRYSFSGYDADGNDIWLKIDWGEESSSDWIGPFDSGEQVLINHSWHSTGSFDIRAKTKDSDDAESDWSDPVCVTILEGPNIAISGINAFGRVLIVEFINSGDEQCEYCLWTIGLEGGFIIGDRRTSGSIEQIDIDVPYEISSEPVIGFGRVDASVSLRYGGNKQVDLTESFRLIGLWFFN